MLKFFDYILTGFYYLMFLGFGLGIIGFFILFFSQFSQIKKKYKRLGIIFLISMAIVFGCGFGFFEIFQNAVRKDIITFIVNNKDVIQVKINDSIIDNSDIIIDKLINVKQFPAHHSSPTDNIKIDLNANNETRHLILGQDSENYNEFWVFVTDYKVTSSNEIGRILNDYFLKFIPETEFERENRRKSEILDEISELEKYFGKETLNKVYISGIDSFQTREIKVVNQHLVKVQLFHLPTNTISYGLSYENKNENYLESLIGLKDKLK